jgi:hypothetical protein
MPAKASSSANSRRLTITVPGTDYEMEIVMITSRKSRMRSRIVAIVAALLLAPVAASAQTAELRGAVEDSTGSALPG